MLVYLVWCWTYDRPGEPVEVLEAVSLDENTAYELGEQYNDYRVEPFATIGKLTIV